MSLLPGNRYTIEITGLSHEGAGVGRLEGTAVFVAGALPGERVEVVLQKVKKKYAVGMLSQVLTPSAGRVEPLCPVYEVCGGCQLQHLAYAKQLEAKTRRVGETLKRIGKLDHFILKPILGMKNPWHYRNKAQLHTAYYQGKLRLGYFRPETWELVPIEDCYLLPPEFSLITKKLEDLLNAYSIEPYRRQTGKGYLKHVILKKAMATGEFMLILVTNGKLDNNLSEVVLQLVKEFPKVVSVYHSISTDDRSNLGSDFTLIHGKATIEEKLGNLTFSISAPAFFQVNVEQMQVLYDQAVAYAGLQGKETVLDLYCGTGTISMFLAAEAKKVHGIEEVVMAVEDAKYNAKLNGIINVEFHAGKVEKILPNLAKNGLTADVIVLDPPRQGCERQVLEVAAAIKPKRMVYVSCDPATLARDLGILQELGYKTVEVQPVDMFPQSGHVECVVLMTRL